jgi:hypothetical protein
MSFGSMVFKPVRTQREPPATDRVLNWAAYGLYQDQNYHLLSAKEVADKKILDSATSKRRYRASPKGKEIQRQYAASEVGKETRRQYAASEVGKESQRKYAASEVGKEIQRKYAASEVGKETRRQYRASEVGKETTRQYAASEVGKESQRKSAARQGDQGTKRARVLLEKFDNGSRPAVQQKTNEPQMGCQAALLGGSC